MSEDVKLNKDGLVPGQEVDFATIMKMRRKVEIQEPAKKEKRKESKANLSAGHE